MTNVYGTNLTTVDGANIKTGQTVVGDSSIQLTTETGPLTHGIFITPKTSANYYVTCDGTTVTENNGMLTKANNPLYIPIKDPSVIKIISNITHLPMLSWFSITFWTFRYQS